MNVRKEPLTMIRIKHPINLSRISVDKVTNTLNRLAIALESELIYGDTSNDILAEKISNSIHDACKLSYKKEKENIVIPMKGNLANCTSSNFKAIAQANYTGYIELSKANVPLEYYMLYLEKICKISYDL